MGRDLLVAEVLLHERFVVGGDVLEQFGAVLVGLVHEVSRDVGLVVLHALFVIPNQRLHGDEVNDAEEVSLCSDGQLHNGRYAVKAVLDHVDTAVEICTSAVHLVDEAHARHVVLVGLAPHGFRLGLNTSNGVEDCHGAIKYAQ